MLCFLVLKRRERSRFSNRARSGAPTHGAVRVLRAVEGSSLVEFAITLPLLVVFIVGIYDFSGAFNIKQKIEHAAQLGAIVAGAQPTSDLDPSNANPDSLQPVVTVIFHSLAADGVLPLANQGACKTPVAAFSNANLAWTYQISGCSSAPADNLMIVINRGVVTGVGPPVTVGTAVQVRYPYHWRFNSAIQLLFPGASYAAVTDLTEQATVHNQT
jgi:Flp pilus assembly protein TadG